ncbi:hypothetical protein PAT3040_05649 [Paenibacillus agaridevorans]|uniref:Uncharacterized protein n=1 Tax=Paenibacillus agaridevorans TaxID=171404 RepID=A0A2R5EZ03_9BACL|nr:hypothetical protein [Paenibacillus agaridevorans]GBG10879.1 hypothetical protein PAT3040_05649 [Paenibacillus agaridevorans]
MEWYERYKPRIRNVFGQALETIGRFPPPIHELGITYAEKFNPANQDGGKDYICMLLPYWMKEKAEISEEQCGQLALANVYGMLYFFIQDDVMDSKVAGGDWKSQLALGSLLQQEMFWIFRALFPSDSPFWRYYDGYVRTWADSVVSEGRGNYFLTNPLLTSGKAAPVKISAVGALLLDASAPSTSTEQRIALTEEAIDIALMTLQMLDDWADWEEDLADGSYNGLLAMIAAGWNGDFSVKSVPPYNTEGLTKERIEAAIYVRCCMKPYANIAGGFQDRLLQNTSAPTDLLAFNAYMIDTLESIANQHEQRKRKLLGGGINLLFEKRNVETGRTTCS